jgi:hypothetical protein
MEEIQNKVDILLADKGLTKDGEEQAVRQLLFHLYTAIDTYRYMTQAEKNAAGRWYRTFKTSFTLRNFLKERKRKRDKEKSPLHPSYKERETEVKEKDNTHTIMREASDLEERQEAFEKVCMSFKYKYDELFLENFFCHWAQEVNGTGLMRWEMEDPWNLKLRLRAWSKKSFQLNDKAAALRLEREKKKTAKQTANTAEQQAIAAKREQDNAKLEQEMEQSKQNQMLTDEYLAKNPNGFLAQVARERQARERKKESKT